MYKEYNQTNKFILRAASLLDGEQTFENIYLTTINNNKKEACALFYNEKGKLESYKYSQFDANVKQYSAYISDALKEQGKHNAIILKVANNPHWPELFYAILMSGYKPLLVDARATKEGASNLAKQAKAVAIITDDAHQYDIRKLNFDDVVYDEDEHELKADWEDEAIFCSSGTTGDVKLMVYNGKAMCNQVCESLDIPLESKDLMYPAKMGKLRILAMVPLHHIFGFVAVFLWFTFYGKTLVYPSSNTPSDLQRICREGKVTHVFSVPLFWDSLSQGLQRKFAMMDEKKQALLDKMVKYNTGKIDKKQAGLAAKGIARKKVQKQILGDKVKYCISGGGFISQETIEFINGVGYNLYNGFGMTELGVTSVELSQDVNQRLKGSIGHPFHGVQYKIVPSDKSNPDHGELFVKSPAMHVREIIGGVEKDVELDKEGYFSTGDIAELDKEGCCYIKGRIKDIIVNADGENIFPDELEIFFQGLPHTTHLAVLGIAIPNTKYEEVDLILELDNTVSEKEIDEIKAEVKKIEPTLPHGVKIARIFIAKNKLPLANGIKVKRFMVKKAIEGGTNEYFELGAKKQTSSLEGVDKAVVAELLEPMREIFSRVLILPTYKIENDAHWINDLGGDSMSYVELINEVQDAFGVTLPEEVLGQLATVNDFVLEVAKLQSEAKKEQK